MMMMMQNILHIVSAIEWYGTSFCHRFIVGVWPWSADFWPLVWLSVDFELGKILAIRKIETSSHVRVDATYAFFSQSQHPLGLSSQTRIKSTRLRDCMREHASAAGPA